MINETEFNRQTREHYKKTPSSEMIDTRPGAGREPTDLKAAKERGEKADWAKTKKIENNQGDDPENDVREGDDSLGKPVAGGQLATSHAALGEVAPVMKDEGISDAQRQRDADAPAFRKGNQQGRVISPATARAETANNQGLGAPSAAHVSDAEGGENKPVGRVGMNGEGAKAAGASLKETADKHGYTGKKAV